jgi:hypothetical protein
MYILRLATFGKKLLLQYNNMHQHYFDQNINFLLKKKKKQYYGVRKLNQIISLSWAQDI